MRDPILALLAKSPAHGYEVRQRLVEALGPPGQALNPGQVYVTLSRLERAGLVRVGQVSQQRHPDKKMYELTAAGSERVAEWLADVSWSKVTPTDFHLKLVAAAATGLADPVALVDAQRHELLRQLSEVQALTLAEPTDSAGGLLLEGAALRLAADVRWLELCEQRWLERLAQSDRAGGAGRSDRNEER
jgi:DNA-binding PadR family transcriptional regulator